MTLYDGPLRPGYKQFFNREKHYNYTSLPSLQLVEIPEASWHHTTWDRRSGEKITVGFAGSAKLLLSMQAHVSYYAGDSQGGRTAEREEH